jgi:predicted amidohydrolase
VYTPGGGVAMRIGPVRVRCEKGAISGNLAVMTDIIQEAERHEIDVLGFPEASLTGYNGPDRYPHAIITIDGSDSI